MFFLAYFDCLAGASGDMILGALVDAGVPLEVLQATAAALQLPGLQLRAAKVERCGVTATKVEVHTIPERKHRHLHHIKDIIHKANLPEPVRDNALRIFQRLAEAEAKVHQTAPEKIHFHEVGAVDAIADVVCAAAGLHYLGVEEILVSPFPLGEVTVKVAAWNDRQTVTPEFEECKRLALAHGLPLQHVYELVREEARRERTDKAHF